MRKIMKQRKIGCILILLLLLIFPANVSATQSRTGNFNKSFTLTGNQANDICSVALAQYQRTGAMFGYTEGWCADFVSDCAILAGASSAIPATGGVSYLKQNILNAGGQVVSTPQVGDIAFMDWGGGGNYYHVEIVYAVSGSTVYTIGGNSGRNTSSDSTSEVWKHGPYAVNHKFFTCFVRPKYKNTPQPPDAEAPSITNVRVSDVSSSGYTVSCTVTDNVGVTRVAFPTWTTKAVNGNDQDDLVWKDGIISGNTATFSVNISDHNNETGTYITHIYAYDAAGNSSSASTGWVTVPEPKCSVTYDVAGGKNGPETQFVEKGSTITIDNVIPEKYGSYFIGWRLSEDSIVKYFPGSILKVEGNYTLIAEWGKDEGSEHAKLINFASPPGGYAQSSYEIPYGGAEREIVLQSVLTQNTRIFSIGNKDTKAELYDATGKLVASDDDSGEDRNFLIDYPMESDHYYLLKLKYFDSSETGLITIYYANYCDINYDVNGGTWKSGIAPDSIRKDASAGFKCTDILPEERFGYSFRGYSDGSWTWKPGESIFGNYYYCDTTLTASWVDAREVSNFPYKESISPVNGCLSQGGAYWFKVTPTLTAPYVLKGTGVYGVEGYLYDSEENLLTKDTEGNNFYIEYDLKAGTTYYLKCKSNGVGDPEKDFGISIDDKLLTVRYVNQPKGDGMRWTGLPENQVKLRGESVKISDIVPKATGVGYDFEGWYRMYTPYSETHFPGESITSENEKEIILEPKYSNADFSRDSSTGNPTLKKTINCPGATRTHSFMPSKSWKYYYEIKGNLDMTAILYDSSGKKIISEESRDGEKNIKFTVDLVKQEYYYLVVSLKDSKKTGDFEVTWNSVACDHAYEEVVDENATCTETGSKTITCKKCGDSYKEEIPATGHQHTELRNVKEATCSEAGYTGDTYCKDCNTKLSFGEVIAKKAHTWDGGKITTEATCTEKGIKTYTCTVCNTTKTEEIPSTGHQHTELRNVKDATCAQEGYTGDTYCKDCNTKLSSGEVIAKKAHTWDGGKITTEATCMEKGIRTFTCAVCESTRIEEIPATGHVNTITKFAKEASCKSDGYSGDVFCQDCGKFLEEGKVIPKKEHTWDAGKVTTAATTTKEGTKTFTCTSCGTTKTEKITKLKPQTLTPGKIINDKATNGVYKVLKDGLSVEFTKPVSKKASVRISDTVKINGITCKVTRISANAFRNNAVLRDVTIGKNVTVLGKQAFYNCKKLRTITIKTSALSSKTIGAKAFTGTYKKPTVKVPAKQMNAYKKLLKSKGMSAKAVYKKS